MPNSSNQDDDDDASLNVVPDDDHQLSSCCVPANFNVHSKCIFGLCKYINLNANPVGEREGDSNKKLPGAHKFSTLAANKVALITRGRGQKETGEREGNLWAMSGMAWRGTCRPAGLISYAVRPTNVIIQYILRALHAELR